MVKYSAAIYFAIAALYICGWLYRGNYLAAFVFAVFVIFCTNDTLKYGYLQLEKNKKVKA